MLKRITLVMALLFLAACDSPSSGGSSSSGSDSAGNSGTADGSVVEGAGFLDGENLTYIVATNAGGGYDAYARMIASYMERYLPVDNIIIRNVPGAGHIVGTNTLWRSRPNGLVIGTFNSGLIYSQIIGRNSVQFKMEEFEWIGKAMADPRALVVSADCRIQSMEDLLAAEEPVKFSSAGIGSSSFVDTRLLSDALELNVEVIPGFDGTEGEMAMMRGEICAQIATSSSLKDFVDAGHGSYILTLGGRMEGVPHAMDYAETERTRKIISLLDAVAQMGRITAAPPGTPQERLQPIIEAYHRALDDPDLRAEAAKRDMPIEPSYGEDVRAMIVAALDQDEQTTRIIRQALDASANAGLDERPEHSSPALVYRSDP